MKVGIFSILIIHGSEKFVFKCHACILEMSHLRIILLLLQPRSFYSHFRCFYTCPVLGLVSSPRWGLCRRRELSNLTCAVLQCAVKRTLAQSLVLYTLGASFDEC